jgi:hypothetical protein
MYRRYLDNGRPGGPSLPIIARRLPFATDGHGFSRIQEEGFNSEAMKPRSGFAEVYFSSSFLGFQIHSSPSFHGSEW